MKIKFIVISFVLLFIPAVAHSQDRIVATTPHGTSAPSSARFEIIQVQFLRESLLLRLDKYTGEVYEFVRNRDLVRDKGQAMAWQLTRWENKPSPESFDAQRVNFQIFAATTNDNSVYLLNVNNGEVWSLVKDLGADKDTFWTPSKTQKK